MARAKTEPGTKDAPKGTKQSTLMGFFSKPKPSSATTAPSSQAPSSSLPETAVQPSSSTIAPGVSSSPASSQLKTPGSAAGSSPAIPRNGAGEAINKKAGIAAKSKATRDGSPLKSSRAMPMAMTSEDEDLSPPPEEIARPTRSSPRRSKAMPPPPPLKAAMEPKSDEVEEEDVQMGSDGSPSVLGRRKRAPAKYVESDSDSGSSSEEEPLRARNKNKPKAAAGRKPRKSLKQESDDDFEMDDGDDDIFAAVAEEFEMSVAGSPTPSAASVFSASPAPAPKRKPAKSKGFVAPKPVPSSAGPSSSSTSGAVRPPVRPLGNSASARSRGEGESNNSDVFLLTAAERRKAADKEKQRENEQVFDFLRPDKIKDKEGRRPDDPEYDRRTVYIPKKCFEHEFTPFEIQFWRIKQNHFDTVLFFQKGKFFELYEDDALIGHQEFDLKLTDRVKMKMVGVPEQSFEFWAAKFLAAGYKVGKVEQAETAIGKDMRQNKEAPKGKKGAAKSDDKEDKIVRRELAQVFTNGTIVDPSYLTSDEANHCVAIKELYDEERGVSAFGVCILDSSTSEFNLSAFQDDACRTQLETLFRQIRPKELLHAKGNLSVDTLRVLRNVLPSNTAWQSLKEGPEFCSAAETIQQLASQFDTEADEPGAKPPLPDAIEQMLDEPLAMEALGGMMFYLRSLNLDKELVSQKNFNIYDPIREGKSLVLDGATLGHMEVLVNNEGGLEGTLLELLQRCQTPFGKRLFRIWLTAPLNDVEAINLRLDAVEDLMKHPAFMQEFADLAKKLPDLERNISRIHAGSIKQQDFITVVSSFAACQSAITRLSGVSSIFDSDAVAGLLRGAPDMKAHIAHIKSMYRAEADEKTIQIMPTRGADPECDEADAEVEQVEGELETLKERFSRELKIKDIGYWSSAQGGKEIYQLSVPASAKVPANWIKAGGTKAVSRYNAPSTIPLIRRLLEARETQTAAKRNFFRHLLAEFSKERALWLRTVRVIAELDCLVSLARSSQAMDEPKCRPELIESSSAFIDFEELRHPSMCLRSDAFIPNNVQLGCSTARQVLLTGPNMAGKSTLLRMTAAGVIMAQLGCYVPAAKARISPVDRIQTRMGAYDNMFASASTFKVELDECSKILREAGPKSFVILDELGRGTSTYDGMAIAGAVLHHLATHTLPLGFFATHYGSLTDDFAYHPNVRRMHMQTHVDDVERRVVFLYKLIPGVAESSHGTHVATMAGVPQQVVQRADQVSQEFFDAFKRKLESKRHSKLPLVAHADFTWLLKVATGLVGSVQATAGALQEGSGAPGTKGLGAQLQLVRAAVGRYEQS